MAEMTVFVSGEGEEPIVVTDEQLDADTGTDGEGPYSVRDLLDDMALHVQTYDLYSGYSMLNAVWALQHIAAGEDVGEIAVRALAEIAISGDFEERVVEDKNSPTGFMLPPVRREDYRHGAHRLDWDDAPKEQSDA